MYLYLWDFARAVRVETEGVKPAFYGETHGDVGGNSRLLGEKRDEPRSNGGQRAGGSG